MDKRPKKISAQKHLKKRILRRKRRRNEKDSETGISEGMARFFVGGEWKIAGFMHVKPPRWTKEYDEMMVIDLVQRIQDDLEELLARAYPTYGKEWAQRFDPNYWRRLPMLMIMKTIFAAELTKALRKSYATVCGRGYAHKTQQPVARRGTNISNYCSNFLKANPETQPTR